MDRYDKLLFSCRCRRTTAHTFITPPACYGCWYCETNLTLGGHFTSRKLPHETYNEDVVLSEDGVLVVSVEICKWCGKHSAAAALRTAISL
jgi:hypothetical protein